MHAKRSDAEQEDDRERERRESARRIAVSYRRLSDPYKQAKENSDSDRRQERDFRNFCKRHNLTPLSKVYADQCSGYHDMHRKKGHLGDLIAEAKAGRFEPGTIIVVEAWDRLGRLRPDKQTDLIAELLRTGVHIGICRLDDIFTEDDFGSHKWTTLAVFVQLAYQESKQKAERIAASWERRRDLARETGRMMTRRLPGWLKIVNGEPAPISEGVVALKRIFHLSANGYGKARIIATLTKEGVPPFIGAGKRSKLPDRWTAPYVDKILNDRRVLGEFQPRKADDTPDGPVILGYYPAIITEEEYHLARAGQSERRGRRSTRDRRYVNVFQSMLVNVEDGEGFFLHNHGTGEKPRLVLVNAAGMAGRSKTVTFPYDIFEEAILDHRGLKEVKPEDVLPKKAEEQSKAEVLRARLKNVRKDITQIQADLRAGYSKHLSAVLREQEAEEERIAAQLQEELAKSVRPAEKAWEQLPSLVDMIRKEGDEARLRLRPVLRSVVEEARVLLVHRRSRIIAAVQFFFVGGGVRHWFIVYQIPGYNRPRRWWYPPAIKDDVLDADDLDLRRREDAEALAEVLAEMDLGEFCTNKRRL